MNHSLTGLSDNDTQFLWSLNISDPKDCQRYSDWLTVQDVKHKRTKEDTMTRRLHPN